MASRVQQHRLAAQRRQDERIADTQNFIAQSQVAFGQASSQERAEKMRRQARWAARAEEERMSEELEQARKMEAERISDRQKEREFREKQRAEELALLDCKKRQLLHERSDELRSLEVRLKEAYLNKERVIQLEERDVQKSREKEMEALLDHVNKKYQDTLEAQEQQRREEAQRNIQITVADQKLQLKLREQQREEERQKLLREKQEIEKIMERIRQDDQRMAEAKVHKQKAFREDIEQFLDVRSKILNDEKIKQEEADRKTQELAEQKRREEEERMLEKKRKAMERNQKFYSMASEVVEQEKRQELLEQHRIELYMEELEEKERLEIAARKQRSDDIIRDMVAANEEIIRLHEKAYRERREEDRRLANYARAEVIKQRELEVEAARQLYEQKQLLRKDIDDTIAAKKSYFTQLREARLLEEKEDLEKQKQDERLLLEEKRAILLAHKDKLGTFMPKELITELEELTKKLG